jgi:MFS family permease
MNAELETLTLTGTILTADKTLPTASASGTAERQTLMALGGGAFVSALVIIIPPAFFPEMARDLHVGVPLLGQIMTAMLLISVFLGLVAGPLSDQSGHRLVIVIGLAAAALCFFAFGLAPTILLLFLASVAGGVTNASVLGPTMAIAGTYFSGTAARRAIGWTSAAEAGSAIVGVPALAFIL